MDGAKLEKLFWQWLALIGLAALSPVFIFIGVVIWLDDGWPIIFGQQRVGKDGKFFRIWKFRTMIKDAEREKERYCYLNEAGGPVFKIKNDPRFTKLGKFLSERGIDELPQLWNILRGEMAFVGPRPLPSKEESKIAVEYQKYRRQVLPGIISPWIFVGYHQVSFEKWMESDLEYVKNRNFWKDLLCLARGGLVFLRLIVFS